MSEYDVALDCQTDWASFWSSTSGESLFRAINDLISKQRVGKGERQADYLVKHQYDELALYTASLLNGECYYWSTQMIDMVKIAATSLPNNWSLMKQHIPAVSGFFYLAKELEKNQVAFAWTILHVDEDDIAEGKLEKAVGIMFPRPDGSMPNFNAISLMTFVRHPDPKFPKPLPTRTSLYVGESLRDWRVSVVREAAKLNADVNEWEDFYNDIRLFATMLSFIQQRILIPTRWGVSRASRRRALITNRQAQPEVNVIKLRSTIHHAHKGEGEEVDWQCRWIVRGHWRDQWYPSLQKHQPIFISPHIKGPEDKPLRDPKRLFAVVR